METTTAQAVEERVDVRPPRYGQPYYLIDGEAYPRVTSFTGALPKPWLASWAAKMVAEFAVGNRDAWKDLPDRNAIDLLKRAPWHERDAAGDRGSAIHRAVEAFLKGEPLPDLEDAHRPVANNAVRFLRDFDVEVHEVELIVANRSVGYAGTLDLHATIAGESWILDWKTSKAVYPEFAVQLAAYRNGEFAIRPDGTRIEWGPEVCERAGAVHLTADGYELRPLSCEPALFTVFRAAKAVLDWTNDNESAVGEPIAREGAAA